MKAAIKQLKMCLVFAIYLLPFIFYPLCGAAFDDISLNARASGMGDAFVGQSNDISAVFYNPSGLAQIREVNYCLSYRDFYNKGILSQNFLAISIPGSFMNTAFSLHRLNSDVEFVDYSEDTYMISLSGRPWFFRNFFTGINLKLFRVFSEINASGYGLDLGFLYKLRKLNAGLLLQNVNKPEILWDSGVKDKIPDKLKFGISYSPLRNTHLNLDFTKFESARKINFGCEIWLFKRHVGLRGGLSFFEGIRNLSSGFSLGFKNFYFDYAIKKDENLGFTNFFTVRIVK